MRPKKSHPLHILRASSTWMLAVIGVPYLSACGAAIMTNGVEELAGSVTSAEGIEGQVSLDEDSIQAILDENPGIEPLEGWAVRILGTTGDPLVDANSSVIVAFTDASGRFRISGVSPDYFRIAVVPPEGLIPYADPSNDLDGWLDGAAFVEMDPEHSSMLRFSFRKEQTTTTLAPACTPTCYQISGTVYVNKVGDLVPALDLDDALLADVAVELLHGPGSTDFEGNRVLDASGHPLITRTNAQGRYSFTVGAGSYKLAVVPPFESLTVDHEAGSDGRLNASVYVIVSNQDVDNVDIGFQHDSRLSALSSEVYATTEPPTTPPPTTEPPTTPPPTTEPPTTPPPTTEPPTTPPPTTEPPTTPPPTTEPPTSPPPTTEPPTSPPPTTSDPGTTAPATTWDPGTTAPGTTWDPGTTAPGTTWDPGTTPDPGTTSP